MIAFWGSAVLWVTQETGGIGVNAVTAPSQIPGALDRRNAAQMPNIGADHIVAALGHETSKTSSEDTGGLTGGWMGCTTEVETDMRAMDKSLRLSSSANVTAWKTRIGPSYAFASRIAKTLAAEQSNCSRPLMTYDWGRAGLGSELHQWGQKLCGAVEIKHRLQSVARWEWLDSSECGKRDGLGCYFKVTTRLCPNDDIDHVPKASKKRGSCSIMAVGGNDLYRAAATEYLFSSGLTTVVQKEVEQQMRMVFGRDTAPPNLITVHIRWGDKITEMKLIGVEKYIDSVHEILRRRGKGSPVHVYISTEDPRATREFRSKAPDDWHVYGDAQVEELAGLRPGNASEEFKSRLSRGEKVPPNHAVQSAVRTKGRAGTQALASLVIAMEADDFVLTTASNWSRMIDELRKNVLDPRCGKCTFMIDLHHGQKRR